MLLIELSVEHVYKRALTLSVLLVIFPFQVTTFISDEWSYYMHENSFTNISEKLCMVIFFWSLYNKVASWLVTCSLARLWLFSMRIHER